MLLTVLGTANPFPVPGNACSGYLLRSAAAPDARPTALWIDAGSGTLAELQRHIALDELDAVFVSHRHADHTSDLLVASYALRFGVEGAADAAAGGVGGSGLARRVRVFGPEGLAERLADFLGPGSLAGLLTVFEFVELHGWGEAVVGELGLAWGPVSHGVPAFGLTVRGATTASAAPRSGFTYSGDTAPCISLVELAEESSTLLCEVGYSVAPDDEYVHCTPEDAGRQATEAGVETLILTHLAQGLEASAAVERARTTFEGTVQVATPGATFAV
ncbi:MBL fold metallo-hydrolase [Subtercola boreus]|uniref:Metallo-beta-lactamase domain-containing protein n=1 Tax=Subtercola boreus TaxID=120213 RepID=A0A3E0WE31_9MICO|nr:MBL fold metallo-hydrolase [Subtercola boreus]RFA23470.1 hypothetical protein B7R24_00825 [Subtercola boreus]RFA23863.1 hypothetical protein B7R23_00825 [Subtercola boreus]RFA29564.1 hypothetical protein B7R25_00820 [Subtercola boreus]